MKRISFLVALVALSVPLAAQEEDVAARTFAVEHFSYNPSLEKFLFRGQGKGLPSGTQLVAVLSLRGQSGPSAALVVDPGRDPEAEGPGESRFSGEFSTEGKTVLPGNYILTVTLQRGNQTDEIRSQLPEDLDEDHAVSVFGWHAPSASSDYEKIRGAIASEIGEIRPIYDEAAQLGSTVTKKISAALEGKTAVDLKQAEKDKLFGLWIPFYKKTQGALEKRAKDFETAWSSNVFLSPYQRAVRGVLDLTEFVLRLRSSYTVEILTALGMADQIPAEDVDRGRFGIRTVISQTNAVAWAVQNDIGDTSIWAPTIRIEKERGAFEGQAYVSSVSGFRISKPNEGWEAVQGGVNSTMRLALNLQSEEGPVLSTIQVHMVEFPWAETKEELAQAWERLAEYEWPGYRRQKGEFVKDASGKEYYDFQFRTRSQYVQTEINCHLYFGKSEKRKHTVYGLMEVTFYEGIARHHWEEDFATILGSFELTE